MKSECRSINQEALTHHRKKHSCGAHFHKILQRAKVCMCSQRNETNSQRIGPFRGYLKAPELLTVQSLTCHVSYILPYYSLMPQKQRLTVSAFMSKLMETDGTHCRKLGKALKG